MGVLTIHQGKVSGKEEPPTNVVLMWENQTLEKRDDGKLLRRRKLRPGTSATLKRMGGSLVKQGFLGDEQECTFGVH